jgi:hypothetical protein
MQNEASLTGKADGTYKGSNAVSQIVGSILTKHKQLLKYPRCYHALRIRTQQIE